MGMVKHGKNNLLQRNRLFWQNGAVAPILFLDQKDLISLDFPSSIPMVLVIKTFS